MNAREETSSVMVFTGASDEDAGSPGAVVGDRGRRTDPVAARIAARRAA